jgi:NTP pyrophosphatase (non-canonical NTP hydrolase)
MSDDDNKTRIAVSQATYDELHAIARESGMTHALVMQRDILWLEIGGTMYFAKGESPSYMGKKLEEEPRKSHGPDRSCSVCGAYYCDEHKAHKHFNALTPAEAERLSWLAEECAEVVVAVEKIKRHGLHSVNPDQPPPRDTNLEALIEEMGQVRAAMILLCTTAGGNMKDRVHLAATRKLESVQKWMHHQRHSDICRAAEASQ